MEQSTFQGKLIKSITDAAAMKVHSKEEPRWYWGRLIRVSKQGKEKVQRRAVFQVIISDGCLFYGNDALRRRGGCCICLLMASGLSAKRFSIWVADASEGEFTYTILSQRLKLAVFIILPRLCYTSHQCDSQSEMDDKRGGLENTKKDFLTYSVRYLSRLLVGKTNGEEIWKYRPPNYPKNVTWKNPTSAPKDSTEILTEKYQYLRSQIPNEKLSQELQKAFQDFESGNIDGVKSFMRCNKWTDQIDNMRNELHYLQPSDLILLQRKLTLLKDQLSSLSSIASSRSIPTATTSSPSKVSRKRTDDSLTPVQSKRSKTEVPICGNYIVNNNTNQRNLPKPTTQAVQTASNACSTVFAPTTVVYQSTAVESPVRSTEFPNQSRLPLVSNTSLDVQCTTIPYHTEAAAATNSQPFMSATGTNSQPFMSAAAINSHPFMSAAAINSHPFMSATGTNSQPFMSATGTNSQPFMSAAAINSHPFMSATGTNSQPFMSATGTNSQPFMSAAAINSQPFMSAAAINSHPFMSATGTNSQPFMSATDTNSQPFMSAAAINSQPFMSATGTNSQPFMSAAAINSHPFMSATGTNSQPFMSATDTNSQPFMSAAAINSQPFMSAAAINSHPFVSSAATHSQSPMAASSIGTTDTNGNYLTSGSHEELSQIDLHKTLTWSQESNLCKKTGDIEIDEQKLNNNRDIQDILQDIFDNCSRTSQDDLLYSILMV